MKNFIKGFRFTPSNYPAAVEDKIQKYRKQGYKLPPRKVLRTPEQLEGIRESAKINTALLDHIAENIREGMSTEEIDRLVYDFTTGHGAVPAPLNYEGFPKSVCTSINDVVCHGIPNKNEILKNGDIIEKASVAGMLEEIDRIVVFPTYLELHFNFSKMIGVTDMNLLPESEQECIRIEYDNLFNYRQGMAEEREQIVQLLIENPDYKAKDIARELDYGLSKTQYRMKVLQEEGRIQYRREGMTGYWEVLK